MRDARALCPYQRWRPGSPGRRAGGAARYRELPNRGAGPVASAPRPPPPPGAPRLPPPQRARARARPRRPPSQWRDARAGEAGARGWVGRAVAGGSVAAEADGARVLGAVAAAAGGRGVQRRRRWQRGSAAAAGGRAGSHAHPQVKPSPDAAPAAQPGAPGEGTAGADALPLAGRGRPARYYTGARLFLRSPPAQLGCEVARLRPLPSSLRRELVLRPHAPAPRPQGEEGEPCRFPPGPSARRAARAVEGGGVTRSRGKRSLFLAGRWARAGVADRRQRSPRLGAHGGAGRCRSSTARPSRPAPERPPAPARAGALRSDAPGSRTGRRAVRRGAAARARPGVSCGVALRRCRYQR